MSHAVARTVAPMEHPTLGPILRRVGMSMLIACIIPATLFYVCMITVNAWFATRRQVCRTARGAAAAVLEADEFGRQSERSVTRRLGLGSVLPARSWAAA
jgi:hypothetical protein